MDYLSGKLKKVPDLESDSSAEENWYEMVSLWIDEVRVGKYANWRENETSAK